MKRLFPPYAVWAVWQCPSGWRRLPASRQSTHSHDPGRIPTTDLHLYHKECQAMRIICYWCVASLQVTLRSMTYLLIHNVKGTGHFFETSSVGSVPGLTITTFTLFYLLTTVFRPKNAFICLCQRSLFCQRTILFFFWYYNQKTITSIVVPA